MMNVPTTLAAHGDGVPVPVRDGHGLLTEGRTELKYCVPARIADRVLDIACGYLPPDPFALGPRQRITSLYLDTPSLTFLRWHRERATDRFKLRIRWYGDDPAPTLYAEVKRKTGSVVRKRRAAFAADALPLVLKSSDVTGSAAWPGRTDDLEAFVRHRSQCAAAPRVLITCVRESLRDAREGTAVTVDRDLRYQPTRGGDLVGAEGAWRPMPLPTVANAATALVELKYALDPPPWMEALIAELAPWRISFSKYAAAMNASAPAGLC
jgi:hypothetical protein